ncbi:hypothetical protein BCR34DRAFT_62686 [Clohesyomyces aquaticus]|uniref:Zn(2)-C6 fungal-type domain-containing protein n=1 Tax=Clohesyomyces aquaticus TaxID=1231657 RepID=A0A1Y2A3R8_9PLEO|nr:hypothetical protein BCR34DRAFT_62686 [Clohesyomyces aquaticus]
MPRLGHKKSRNGCRQCKARHVKCDEQRPCSSCARHGVQCSLITWDSNSPAPPVIKQEPNGNGPTILRRVAKPMSRKNSQAPTPASLPIEYVLNPSPAPTLGTSDGESPHSKADPFPYLTKLLQKSESIQPNYWVRDLELMHHWTTEAHLSLSGRQDIQLMYQVVAPKCAITHQFLMHELLAYSALHMAYSRPDQRKAYYALGSHHQDLAIRCMRQVIPNMSEQNAPAMFITSSLLPLTVLAINSLDVSRTNLQSSPIDELLDVFALVQGMHSIIGSTRDVVRNSPIGIIMTDHPMGTPVVPLIDEAYHRITDLRTLIESRFPEEDDVRTECLNAIAAFREHTQQIGAPNIDNRELRMLFLWPCKLSSNYLNMLRQKEPVAIAIMAYYATILSAAESKNWFLNGWAERIIATVEAIVEPNWKQVMQWPIQVIAAKEQQKRERQGGSSTMRVDVELVGDC